MYCHCMISLSRHIQATTQHARHFFLDPFSHHHLYRNLRLTCDIDSTAVCREKVESSPFFSLCPILSLISTLNPRYRCSILTMQLIQCQEAMQRKWDQQKWRTASRSKSNCLENSMQWCVFVSQCLMTFRIWWILEDLSRFCRPPTSLFNLVLHLYKIWKMTHTLFLQTCLPARTTVHLSI